jgi:tetratricopeptide (TPR) repeat protein
MAEIKKDATGIDNVGTALTRAEQFIENNQKMLLLVVGAIVVVVLIFFGFKYMYLVPQDKEAHAQMFAAEQYFEKDSFNLALRGDGNNWGFIKIIDEYGFTKAANLSHYYAGICYLRLGKYSDAIDHLKSFKADDNLVGPVSIGATGDAYLELGKKEEALKYYLKAAKKVDNEFTAPIYLMKAGVLCDDLGDYQKALDIYNKIKDKYPMTMEGRQIDKYIARSKTLLENKK